LRWGRPKHSFLSTRLDLLPTGYRSAAREAAVNAGFLPHGMEDFAPSGDLYTLDKCLEYVSQADLLVVIVAHRYGWIPPDQPGGRNKSVTWLECQYAREVKKIEVLRFFVKDDDDKWKWPLELREEHRLTEAIQRGAATPELFREVQLACAQLKAFKEWLEAGRGLRRDFDSPAELSKWLVAGLYEWRERNPGFGPAPPGDPSTYLEKLWAATRWIDITGLQVGDATKKQFQISRIYIPLTTMAGPAEPAKGRGPEVIERVGRGVPLEQALAHPRLVIVGDPGAGKTTFVHRVAFALCQTLRGLDRAEAQRFLGVKEAPFPFLIPAAELAAHVTKTLPEEGRHPTAADSPAWIPHWLAARSEEFNWGLSEDFFRQKLKTDACLLLVDGMDEAPGRAERESLARLIEKACGAYKNCRFVVTTRPQTYRDRAILEDFESVQIGDLGPDAVRTFLDEWAQALYSDEPGKAEAFRSQLERSVASRRDIRRLARNPVMLTALAVLQANNRKLPEERVGLYESILTWLAQSREGKAGRVRAERCLELLQKLALAMQTHPDGRQVQVDLGWATDQLTPEFRQRAEAEKFLRAEEADSGIIVSRGSEVRYWHLTFQEYLAAREIAGLADATQYELAVRSGNLYRAEWREVMPLLAGVLLHRQGKAKANGLIRAILNQLGARPPLAAQARCAGLLGAMVRDLAPMGFEPKDPRYLETVHAVRRIFDPKEAEGIDLKTRIEAAEALGQVGDSRLDEDNWVTIPAGTFWMGAQPRGKRNPDPEAYGDEGPVHEVFLNAFQIGRYPVTVQEFARFIEEGGYQDEQYWQETGGFGQFEEPEEWQDQQMHRNRPVVGVSWHEAAAYCRWAGARLPTEAEWERAARGPEGARYPWGSQPIDPSRANYGGEVGSPTPVGLYPGGATSEGVWDLIGNVWEWCWDWFGPYENKRVENPRGPKEGELRLLRGGSWNYDPRFARVSNRDWTRPVVRNVRLGFRCAREVIP